MTASSRRRYGIVIGCSSLVSTLATWPAIAQQRGSFVEWSAPSPCPEQSVLDEEVAELAAGRVFPGSPLRADVVFAEGSFVLTLRESDGAMVRRASAADCETLASLTALIVATSLVAPGGPEPAPVAADPDQTSVTIARPDLAPTSESSVDPRRDASTPRSFFRFLAGVSIGAAFAPLPVVEPLALPWLGVGVDGFEFVVGPHLLGLASQGLRPAAWLSGVRLSAGWMFDLGPLRLAEAEFGVEAGVRIVSEVAQVHVAGPSAAASDLWVSLGGGVEGRLYLDRAIALAVWVDVVPALRVWDLIVDGLTFRVNWASIVTAIGLVIRIP